MLREDLRGHRLTTSAAHSKAGSATKNASVSTYNVCLTGRISCKKILDSPPGPSSMSNSLHEPYRRVARTDASMMLGCNARTFGPFRYCTLKIGLGCSHSIGFGTSLCYRIECHAEVVGWPCHNLKLRPAIRPVRITWLMCGQ